jgi:predicted nucleic acid-binding protein
MQPFAALASTADREVLAVALERGVNHILSGDRAVRRETIRHNLTCLATSQVVVLLKLQGEIPAARPVLDQMRQQGFGIGGTDYQQALQAAGEQP